MAAQSSSPTSKRAPLAALTAAFLGLPAWDTALAYPDGAPWGAANLDNSENCSSCHFESEPIRQSNAIVLKGFGDGNTVAPNTSHVVRIILNDPYAATAGFQLLASADSGDPGRFESDAADIEVIGEAARSIAPRTVVKDAAWSFTWHSPSPGNYPVTFTVAISAANDDGSPFGDRIHYRVVTIEAPTRVPDANDAD